MKLKSVSANQKQGVAKDGTKLRFKPHPQYIVGDPCKGCYLANYNHGDFNDKRCFAKCSKSKLMRIQDNCCCGIDRNDSKFGVWVKTKP